MGKVWKKLLFIILIVACLFNIISKLIKRNSLQEELQATFDYLTNKQNGQTSITQENDSIVIKTKAANQNNKYIYNKELEIDQKTGKPVKLIVEDINKKNQEHRDILLRERIKKVISETKI